MSGSAGFKGSVTRLASFMIMAFITLMTGSCWNGYPGRPDLDEQLYSEAYQIYNMAQYERTIELCDMMLKSNPRSDRALDLRGLAFTGLEDYETAIYDFTRAIEIDSNIPTYYANRAYAESESGLYEKTIDDYTSVITLDGGLYYAFNGRAWAYLCMGNPEPALPDVNRALELNPSDNNSLDTRAVYYYMVGNYEKALEDINAAISVAPDYAEHYFHRGQIYLSLDNIRDAYDDLAKAVDLDPSNREAEELLNTTEAELMELFESEAEKTGDGGD